jgi:hypothetical protein
MANSKPGTYVLFKELRSAERPSLGVVVADDDAPKDVQDGRPAETYRTLVLLTCEPYTLFFLSPTLLLESTADIHSRWAYTHQISEDLEHEAESGAFMVEAMMNYEYWRGEIARHSPGAAPSRKRSESTEENEVGVDEEA